MVQQAKEKAKYKVIGTRPIRHDGVDKVTGRAQYGADIRPTGLLYAKMLRSPHAHARIKKIDVSRALAHPGVRAVVTSADLAEQPPRIADLGEGSFTNMGFLCMNVLARGKVLFKGHAVAAVAAINAHVAEEAVGLIDVEYEVLPVVLDGLEAMKPDAPLLHERLASLSNPNVRPGGLMDESDKRKGSNVANHFVFEIGDIAKGFAQASIVVERWYKVSAAHQGYIEPLSATAKWNPDSSLTIWCSSQGHFTIREQTAKLLGLPVSKVKVVPMEIGGGFGAKTQVFLEPVVALLSKKSGHPVKMTINRTEVFEAIGPTSGGYVRAKMGVTTEGRIIAADATLVYEAGAFPGSPVSGGAQCLLGPYDIPNARVEGYDVVVNKPKVTAYRAPGAPSGAFAAESLIDEIAQQLKMDPIDFRLMNSAKEGTRRVSGPVFGSVGFVEVLKAAKAHPHWKAPLTGKNRGRGVAAGFWHNGAGPASATVSVNADGTVNLVEGSPDIGGSRATAAMQVAEVLGLRAEDVRPQVADTESIGFTSTTGGSGATFKTGWASHDAAQEVKQQMLARAATIWNVKPDDLKYEGGVISHKSDPALRMPFRDLAARLNDTGGPIAGRGAVNPRGVGAALSVNIADVEVDPDTGKTTVLRYTAIQDVGTAIHPSYVEGQMQGGAVQGIGWALTEEFYFSDKGQMMNSSFLDYRMPTALDIPMIDTVVVEVPNPGHPFGVRGVGEVCIVPPLAAIGNAIHRATGVRMHTLPMSPNNLQRAIAKKGDDVHWTVPTSNGASQSMKAAVDAEGIERHE
ncbi:MAG: xanthine dehydrogenase family protein molybdopterin-binding subunit [Dehalococcoidia bacterium]|nr:xanthine dehydrogenase family protein molybdopterin-binding subunit [Dehalococcoidia bacterium]